MTTTSSDGEHQPSGDEQLLYKEWQRPWITAIYAGATVGALVVAAGLLRGVLDGVWFDGKTLIGIGGMFAFGALVAVVSARFIRLGPEVLRIGGKRIPLVAVTDTAILRGRELWRVRSRLSMPASRTSPLLLGGAIPIVGLDFTAGYIWATRKIRNGNCCSPGQGPAVALATPSLQTPLWIVGSRHAEQLKALIDDARAALPPPPDPDDPNPNLRGDEGGWLPPRREH